MRVKVYNNRLKVYGGRVKYNYPNESKAVVDAIQTTDQLNAIQRLYGHFIIGMEINEVIWAKNTALYGNLGGTAASHALNWKDPRNLDAAFRLTFPNGATHDNNGILFNGTTQYAETFINPSTQITPTNLHLSVYSNTLYVGASATADISTTTNNASGANLIELLNNNAVNQFALGNNAANLDFLQVPIKTGYLLGNIFDGKLQVLSRDILSSKTNTVTYQSSTNTFKIGVRSNNVNFSLYSNKQYQMISLGLGLTEAQAIRKSQIATFAQKIKNRA